jgi:hypothetical protein
MFNPEIGDAIGDEGVSDVVQPKPARLTALNWVLPARRWEMQW